MRAFTVYAALLLGGAAALLIGERDAPEASALRAEAAPGTSGDDAGAPGGSRASTLASSDDWGEESSEGSTLTSSDDEGLEYTDQEQVSVDSNGPSEFQVLDYARVPPIADFTKVWHKRYESETHLTEPLPEGLRLILGVFTVAQDTQYRNVVRATWLNQTGVCLWSSEPQEGCGVYVAFVIGNSGAGVNAKDVTLTDQDLAKAHAEPGMFVLSCEENMDKGKSLVWFKEAVKAFPWASHIGKTDMDTYPFVHKLAQRMTSRSGCVHATSIYEFIGRPHNPGYSQRFENQCKPRKCSQQWIGLQDRSRIMPPVAPVGGSFKFLSGELYILSYKLAKAVQWDRRSFATEDAVVARGVDEAATATGHCVVIRRLDSWYHKTDVTDPDFANKFW